MTTSPTLEDAVSESWSDLFGPTDDSPEDPGSVEPPADNADPTDEDPQDEVDSDVDADEDVEQFYDEDDDEDLQDEDVDEGEGEEAPETASEAIELSEDDVIRLPDGTEVPVKEAVLFQSGFTKKTQELAEERAELEAQQQQAEEATQRYEQVAEEYQSDPSGFVRKLIAGTQDPTLTFAQTIKGLADEGQLDPAFAEAFNVAIGKAREVADQGETTERLSRLEQQLEQEREQQQQSQRQQQLVQHYLGQWGEIKTQQGLQYDSPDQERQAWRDVVSYAAENQIVDLRKAYAAMAYERGAPGRQQGSGRKDPAAQKRKRTSAKVARRSSSGGARPPAKKDSGPLSLDDAISESIAELKGQGS